MFKEDSKFLDYINEKTGCGKDVLANTAVINITGRSQVIVENYLSILAFQDEIIKVRTRKYILVIKGKNLIIKYYNNTDMCITGLFNEISFE